MANKERVQLLIDALESDQFTQGIGALERYPDVYGENPLTRVENCCLGVACRVAMANGLDLPTERVFSDRVRFADETGFLPWQVREWFEFDTSDPALWTSDEYDEQSTAVGMNDGRVADFRGIASAFKRTYIDDVPNSASPISTVEV